MADKNVEPEKPKNTKRLLKSPGNSPDTKKIDQSEKSAPQDVV